jgi:hypothetical protein
MRLPTPVRFVSYVLAVAVVRAHLRVFGFRRTLRRARAVASGSPRPHRTDAVEVATEIARRVESAAAVFPGRARCLEQSLCVYLLLGRRGIPAELRIGARALPFAAHAWVEVDGQSVNTEPEFLASFQAFPEIRA